MPVRVYSPFDCIENCDAKATLTCIPPATFNVVFTHDQEYYVQKPVMGFSIGTLDSDIQVWADISPDDQRSYMDRLTNNQISALAYHMGIKWRFRNMLSAPLRYLSLKMEEGDRDITRVRLYF
jgi:hypothetical protein